jgi:hypothetical protein
MVRPCSCQPARHARTGVKRITAGPLSAASLYGLARGHAQRSEPVYFPAPRRALFQPRLLLPIDGAAAQVFSGARDPIAPPARRPDSILEQTRAHDDHGISAGGQEPSREMMRSAHLAVHMPRTPDRSSVPPCSSQSGQGPRVDRQDATALDRPCARRRRELRSAQMLAARIELKNGPNCPTRSHPATSP